MSVASLFIRTLYSSSSPRVGSPSLRRDDDVSHAIEEEDDTQEKKEVVVPGDHVLGTEIHEGSNVRPIGGSHERRIFAANAMGDDGLKFALDDQQPDYGDCQQNQTDAGRPKLSKIHQTNRSRFPWSRICYLRDEARCAQAVTVAPAGADSCSAARVPRWSDRSPRSARCRRAR